MRIAALAVAAAALWAGPDAGAPDDSPWEGVKAEVKRHMAEIDRCYARTLQRDPCAHGSLIVWFDVQPDGRVSAVHADEAPSSLAALSACVTGAVGAWRMPPLPGASFARVHFPFTFGPPAAEPEQSCGARILDQAAYAGVQLPSPGASGAWSAVCGHDGAFDLRRVHLTVKPFRDEMAADTPAQKTGRGVSVSGCAQPALLVQGIYGATLGPLPKARFENRGEGVARTAAITLDTILYQLRYEGDQTGPWRIVLAGLGAPAAILSWTGSPPSGWNVRWAGDLDGDKHPDFVIEEITESGATILHLFVSRAAARGADVREVAQTTHGGC